MSFTETVAAGRAFAVSNDPPSGQIGSFSLLALPICAALSSARCVRRRDVANGMWSGRGRTNAEGITRYRRAALATCWSLRRFLGLLPKAVLAAIVIVYSIG
jgi:hypothetical protein